MPPPAPALAPQFEFSIPAPQRGPVPRAVDEIEFDVSDIQIAGSTIFKPAAFKPFTAPLIGHKARLSDIIGVADKVEGLYREHGYVLTRAFVPPQTVANGVFRINVVEGFVKAAAVSGGTDSTRQYVNAYVAPVTTERPATLQSLERGLLLANDLPGVSASGLLRPSPTAPGASDLLVNMNQTPWEGTLYFDNRGAESTDRATVGLQLLANNLYYVPGQAMIDVSGDPGLQQRKLFQARYARPVGYQGAILEFTGVLAHGVPAAASGTLISDSYAVGAQVTYPLVVSRARRITLQGGLNVQGEKVTLGDDSFCVFSDDHWRTVDAAGTVEQRGLLKDSDTAATFGITQGIPVLGAESTPSANSTCAPAGSSADASGESTGFTKFTFVGSHDQPIYGPVSANFHALGQYTGERLVVGEQTSFGGSGIGRGYDPASLAADIGVGLASELRYDMHLPRYYIETAQFYTFFDAAKVRPLHDELTVLTVGEPNSRSLMSAGFGVRVALLQTLTGGIEFAQELRGVPNNDGGKTSDRVLFNAAVRF